MPVLVLTEAQAGTPQSAEAGDRIEVRLVEGAPGGDRWQLSERPAENLVFEGERADDGVQAFRFLTRAAGRARLDFRRGDRVLTFTIELR